MERQRLCDSEMNRLGVIRDGSSVGDWGDIHAGEQTCWIGINSAVLARKPNRLMA
jgi:hypothetical protein